MGIESAYYSTPPFYYCQTYALGEVDVSPARHGLRLRGVRRPRPAGRADPDPRDRQRCRARCWSTTSSRCPATTTVLPANVADNVTNVLQGVITGGTGTAAQLGRPAAGKTGTTSNYTNAWFVGYTPTLSTAVWMGNAASQATPIGNVKGVDPVYGGTWPALTWRAFMSQALRGVPATPFTEPAPIVPPQPAAALASGPTTTVPVEPGAPRYIPGTPVGGPYQVPAPAPAAPEPVTTTTSPPPTTTTTSTTVPSPGPGSSTTTTTSGGGPAP